MNQEKCDDCRDVETSNKMIVVGFFEYILTDDGLMVGQMLVVNLAERS